MASFNDHPTVRLVREQVQRQSRVALPNLDAAELRRFCLNAGADDIGFVAFSRPELDDQRDDILKFFPATKTLISFVCRMNREPIRNPARSVANLEFHDTTNHVNEVARKIVSELESLGYRAINPSAGFPMETAVFPGKIWVVSHKPVAVAAGLGSMGIHRNVIHPKFGNFILLGTVLVDAEITEDSRPVQFNPCLECKLCVAACPVGAISPDGSFNFLSCYTHNYREFMGGFTDWVETVADSRSGRDYRSKVSDGESASMWQSLAFGPNYKAAYCLSVCPAGEDVIRPFLDDRSGFIGQTLKPLQQKEETIYVQPNTDADEYVRKRFPHKQVKQVGDTLRPTTIDGFMKGMHIVFQPGRSKGLKAVYHFRFTGREPGECTVTIRDQKIEVRQGHIGDCDLRVTANSSKWVQFLRKEVSIVWLLMTMRVRLKGNPVLLVKFGKCFP
ncbi:MAG: 4Fe-4S ferredoxin [Planctomycetota bacterium]|nr:MAG: 4Fe-4S ferredoxin [Planctomycetota bacterium]